MRFAKSISGHIRQLILDIKGYVGECVQELTFAKRLHKHFLWDKIDWFWHAWFWSSICRRGVWRQATGDNVTTTSKCFVVEHPRCCGHLPLTAGVLRQIWSPDGVQGKLWLPNVARSCGSSYFDMAWAAIHSISVSWFRISGIKFGQFFFRQIPCVIWHGLQVLQWIGKSTS